MKRKNFLKMNRAIQNRSNPLLSTSVKENSIFTDQGQSAEGVKIKYFCTDLCTEIFNYKRIQVTADSSIS